MIKANFYTSEGGYGGMHSWYKRAVGVDKQWKADVTLELGEAIFYGFAVVEEKTRDGNITHVYAPSDPGVDDLYMFTPDLMKKIANEIKIQWADYKAKQELVGKKSMGVRWKDIRQPS